MRTHEQYLKWVLETTNKEYDGDLTAFSKALNDAYRGGL